MDAECLSQDELVTWRGRERTERSDKGRLQEMWPALPADNSVPRSSGSEATNDATELYCRQRQRSKEEGLRTGGLVFRTLERFMHIYSLL